jgi:hypothetical protein
MALKNFNNIFLTFVFYRIDNRILILYGFKKSYKKKTTTTIIISSTFNLLRVNFDFFLFFL